MKNIFLIVLCLVLVAGCKKEETGFERLEKIKQSYIQNAQSDFERQCYIDNNGWMSMIPMENGKIIADDPCMGCMTSYDTHICDFEKYKNITGK